jgi:hypothetical protein
MRIIEFLLFNSSSLTRRHSNYFILSILGIALILFSSIGCAPSEQAGDQNSPASASTGQPELTQEIIEERINEARVYDVLPESGTGEPIPWSFDEDEPKEISVVDRQVNGPRATITLDIKTQSSPQARNLRSLSGQVRTEWELRTGWVLRRWEIVNTENISMKYRDLPKPVTPNASP